MDEKQHTMLQLASVSFGGAYPNGQKGVLNIFFPSCRRDTSKLNDEMIELKNKTNHNQATSTEQNTAHWHQQLANLWMSPVDAQLIKGIDEQHINQPVISVDVDSNNNKEDGKSCENEEISALELNYHELVLDNVLHGYTPDNG